MIEVLISTHQVNRAIKLSNEMGALNNSMLSGAGNVTGFLGEIIVADYYGFKQANTFEFDLINNRGQRIEVKSKNCNSIPKSHYYVAVEIRHQQECDFYFFTRIMKSLKVGWILGWMPPYEFKQTAKFFPAGTDDPHAPGWKNKLNNLQLEIGQLHKPIKTHEPS